MKIDTNNTLYSIVVSNVFKKQIKKIFKQGCNISKINMVIEKLANGEVLDIKYKDHMLINNKYFKNCRECHIEPDWLLIYKYNHNQLILYLIETGSHSELFDM